MTPKKYFEYLDQVVANLDAEIEYLDEMEKKLGEEISEADRYKNEIINHLKVGGSKKVQNI